MKKKPITYAFIDSQNLNMGVRSEGWKLDYRVFRQYLRSKYNISKAFIFIGHIDGNESLYTSLQTAGFILVFKPTMQLPNGSVKGNVDAELVLHAMIQYPHYDTAVIVSGDGDFYCLVEYLEKNGKLLKIMVPNKHFSGFLRKFNRYIVRIDLLRVALEIKKTKISGRSKP
ncbi:MAG: NYN domain-containing protein [Actinomycetota bacterium]